MALEDDVLKDVPEVKEPEPGKVEPEPQKTETELGEPSPEKEPEKETPKESQIASILDEDLAQQRQKVRPKTVPLSELQSERAKRRELERQLKEIQETAPQSEAAAIGDVLAGLEGDDYVSVDTLRKVLKTVVGKPKGLTADDVETIIAQNELAREIKLVEARAIASEVDAMEAHDDYNEVITDARDLGLITKSDREKMMDSAKPAEKLYQICKRKVEKAREIYSRQPKPEGTSKKESSKSASKTETKGEIAEEDLKMANQTDEEIFETSFGSAKK